MAVASRLGWRLRVEGGLFARAAGARESVRRDCVNLEGWNGRHSRWERLIGSAVPVRALLSAATGAEHDHGRRQRDGHDVSQENGAGLQERGTVAIRRMVPPQSGQMAKSAAVSGRSPLV